MAPKQVDHDVYRKELLMGAFQILVDKGYGSSMRDIAKASGVSTGTLYHYFPNKQQLFEQMVCSITSECIARSEALVVKDMSVAERFAALRELIIAESPQLTAIMLLSIEYKRVAPKEVSTEFFTEFFDKFTKALSTLLGVPSRMTHLIMATTDGLFLRQWIEPNTDEFRKRLILLEAMMVTYMNSEMIEGSGYE